MTPKNSWRELLLKRRKEISIERREEAALLMIENLKDKGRVLSFTSIGSEINTGPLNAYLKSQGRLFLVPYKADAIVEAPLDEIDCIIVPGLGFDRDRYRIGYGKGYYDRFLAGTGNIPTIGVGFKEQFCEELLPRDPWDVPLHALLLV